MDWRATRCDCEKAPVLIDGLFQGLIRVVCPCCKRRVWLAGDGKRVLIAFSDQPPARVKTE